MLNPKTLKEALDFVCTKLNEFEYILLQGRGLFGYEPKVLSVAIGYWNTRIVMHLLDENQVTLSSCDIDNDSLIQNQLNKIIKCYKIDVQNIGFILNSTTKEISEFAFHNKKQIFKIISIKNGEQSVSLSYQIQGRISDDKLFHLSQSYQNILNTIHEDADIHVVRLNSHPVTLIRKRKLKEIGINSCL